MRIIGPPSASLATVERWLGGNTGVHPRFTTAAGPLWTASVAYTIDPVGVIAQAGKETGWGNYPGKVKPEFYNTCGLKIRHQNLFPGITEGDNPLAHAMFPSWEVGAEAHVQHLRAYAGWPVDGLIVDPRYVFVIGKHACENFSELGGKWAPSPAYGTEIEAIMAKMRGSA